VNKIFISIGIGRVNVDGEEVLVVASTSPLGKVLMGRSVGDAVTFNGQSMTIVDVV
jgi:transcription elongation GreA/GreB family factor